jgi:predicted HTH domain antitoxin
MKKEELVASRVPSDLVSDLKKLEETEHIDRSTAVRKLLYSGIKEWKLRHAAELYRDNKVTMAKASEEAGVSLREMMEYLRQKKIPMQYDLEDFEHDLKVIYKHMGKKPPAKLVR